MLFKYCNSHIFVIVSLRYFILQFRVFFVIFETTIVPILAGYLSLWKFTNPHYFSVLRLFGEWLFDCTAFIDKIDHHHEFYLGKIDHHHELYLGKIDHNHV